MPSAKRGVLLLTPPLPETRRSSRVAVEEDCPPLGLLYLAASMRTAAVPCDVRDLYLFGGAVQPDDLARAAVIGISFTTPCAPSAYKLSRDIRHHAPSTVLVAGGHHATALPEDCLLNGSFDFVLTGEAEHSFVLLAQAVLDGATRGERLDLRGLVALDNGQPRRSPSPAPALDPARLPWPSRDLVPIHRYAQSGAIIGARGCPGRCVFCAAPASRKWVLRPVDDVVAEIAHLAETCAVHDVVFHDDSFTADRQWVSALCAALAEQDGPVRWGCTARAVDCDHELLSMMADAGCMCIHLGAESGSDEVLRGLHKGCTRQGIEAAVVAAKSVGIQEVRCSFMIGAPTDTEQTIRQTIRFAAELRRLGASFTPFSIMTPYPGSPLFGHPEKYGVTIHSRDWARYVPTIANMSTSFLSQRQIEELSFDAIASLHD